MTTQPTKKPKAAVCMLCGKPSGKSICDTCAQRVQSEHLDKKIKHDKGKD